MISFALKNWIVIFVPLVAVLAFSLNLFAGTPDSTAQEKNTVPNLLLILADDAGYGDFGFQGSQVMKTPYLDQLAKQSVRCTQAYVTAAVCGPSRAGLLTGKYQQRFGYEENNVPGYMSLSSRQLRHEMGLPIHQKTIADHLRALGYRTGLVGKWHLGNADRFHPLRRGFDHFVGFRGGARSYWALEESHFQKRPEDRWERGFGDFREPAKYLTSVMTDEAIQFIDKSNDRPFFLMLSFNAVHTPLNAQRSDLEKFPKLSGKRQLVAAMGLAMDRAVGRVLMALDERGLANNTIVIFTNDNGGPSDTNHSNNAPLSGTKANHLEGGIRVPMLIRWPGVTDAGVDFQPPVSTLDILPTVYAAAGGDAGALEGMDGVDLRPWLAGDRIGRPHQVLFWKKESRAAIRDGDWKLLRYPDRPAELYNLSNDIGEQNNLAASQPAKVRAMFKQLFDWELTLDRPRWMLRREYEGKAMQRMDRFRLPATLK